MQTGILNQIERSNHIVEAIAAGDPERAEAEARRHVVEASRNLTRVAVGRDHKAEAEPA